MHISKRFTWNLENNALARALAERRAAGLPVLDLAESNPARAGFSWDAAELAAALSHPENSAYNPDPRGLPQARLAVADYYREHGAVVPPERIHLSASTSEAYGWVLKLLTDPGDAVLTPAPSYPLLQFLAAMECVSANPYPLVFADGHWRVDAEALEAAVTPTTRAIFCVSPNNPTGTVADAADREVLRAVARRHGLALVVDEVFLDFGAGNAAVPESGSGVSPLYNAPLPTWAEEAEVPLFVLSGLSKVSLLPQLKLGWLVTAGPETWRAAALERLDFIADTYLSVNTPVQYAAGAFISGALPLRDALNRRVAANERVLREWCATGEHGLRVLPREAGWTALVELPKGINEEALMLDLARRDGVSMHPGYFYDLPSGMAPHWVVSLITPEAVLAEALPRLAGGLRRH
jgi:aspartate/methionine/tyrosine aminotransferase